MSVHKRELTQHKLDRVRAPRVHITYDVETGGAVGMKELPFVLGVLADLSGNQREKQSEIKFGQRKFVDIDRDNFDHVLARINPQLLLEVPDLIQGGHTFLTVNLKFQRMEDFEPEGIVNQVEPLQKMLEVRCHLLELLCKTDGNDRLTENLKEILANQKLQHQFYHEIQEGQFGKDADSSIDKGLLTLDSQTNPEDDQTCPLKSETLDLLIVETKIGGDDQKYLKAKEQIGTFLREALGGKLQASDDLEKIINQRISEIDGILSNQVSGILHAPDFQKLEATWQGLHFLVHQSETSTMLKIRVLNVSKDEIRKDLGKASEFDQSALFKKIYEEEWGTFGGAPYGAVIGDYEFSQQGDDVEMLEKISSIAASAHAPFITAASPVFFGMKRFTEIPNPRDLAKTFDSADCTKWKYFRDSEDSRYVALVLPHILMRLPYGPDTNPVEAFNFRENVDGTDHDKYLWGNTAYAFGTRLTNAFAKYGWIAAIRGVEGGGCVEGLPFLNVRTDDGEQATKCPTEIAITDRREKELSDLGFLPLVHCRGSDYAAFFSASSCKKPQKYESDMANANARLSLQLQYLFPISRFAHYLKCIIRDKPGAFMTRRDCEVYLNRWISAYILVDDGAGFENRAKFPLREGRIDVAENPAKPGTYKAVCFLRPHFQLDELSVSLRLVVELPAAAH